MAYSKGDQITAADLNAFLTTVNSVYGTGTGNTGYGQTSLQAAVSAGNIINSSHFTNLRTMITTCATHQGTSVSALVPANLLDAGDTITAHETGAPSSNAYDLDSYVTAINTNRLTAAGGAMSIIAGSTITRATAWSTTITCTVDVIWGSEDAARFFFNTGGQVRLNFTQPGATSQDNDWRNILVTLLGEVRLGASSTTNTGSSSGLSASGVGFHNLTTTATSIVTGTNVGAGAYASNDISITAQVLNKVGTNGGNGNTIRFVVLLSDQHTGGTDSVTSGTALAFSAYKATTYLTGIATPTYTTQTAF